MIWILITGNLACGVFGRIITKYYGANLLALGMRDWKRADIIEDVLGPILGYSYLFLTGVYLVIELIKGLKR